MAGFLNNDIIDTYNYLKKEVEKDNVVIYKTTSDPKKVAYVSRSRKDKIDAIKLVTTEDISEEFRKYLTVHEYGHIYFSHILLMNSIFDIMANTINKYREKLSKKLKNCKSRNASENYVALMANIAQDLEINSKFYTDDQLDVLNEFTIKHLKEENLNGKKYIFQHPDDYKDNNGNPFPRGKSFWEYFQLLLNQDDQNDQVIFGKSTDSDGDSDDEGDGCSSSITDEDLEKALEEAMSSLDDGASESDETEVSNSIDEANLGKGYSSTGQSSREASQDIVSSNLSKILPKIFYRRTTKTQRTDNMYYYNRNKYNSNVLIPKMRTGEFVSAVNAKIIIDCSGSMDTPLINDIIRNIKKATAKGVISKDSKIIWWNTALVSEQKVEKISIPDSSGGTKMAEAFSRYGKKLSGQDLLVVISDYEDNLSDWKKELSKIKATKVGILYGNCVGSTTKSYLKELKKSAGLETYIVNCD